MSEREVENGDVQFVFVINRELNGVQHVARQASAIRVKHSETHELGFGGDAAIQLRMNFVKSTVRAPRFDLSI